MYPPALARRATAMLSAAAVMLVGLVMTAPNASAVSPNLVVSQVYGGGGNSGAPYTHDFIELFNRGSAAVSLTGMSIQYASATGTGNLGANSGQLTELPNVTLQPGQYYLVQQAGGTTGVPLPTPDLFDATPIAMAAGAGKVALATGTTSLGCNGGSTPCSADQLARIVDLVGYGSANFFEGSAAAPGLSNTTAALRSGGGCTDTDDNVADFTAAAPAPRNSSAPLAPCGGDPVDLPPTTTCPASLFAPFEQGASAQVSAADDNDGIGSIAIISAPVDGITLENIDLTTRSATLTVAPTTAPGSYDVTIEFATDAATPQTETCSIAVTVEGPRVITPISEIQGTGAVTPLAGREVITTGVVTAAYPTGGFRGIYIQTPGTGGIPKTPGDASDGIFVFSDWAAKELVSGDCVEVKGTASEFFTLTQLSNAFLTEIAGCDPVTPTKLATLPVADAEKEVYEGMLVLPQDNYTITNNFQTNRFGQLGLAVGDEPLYQATDMVEPGPEAVAYEAENRRKYITLDDGSSFDYLNNVVAKNTYALPYLSHETPMRTGAQVTFEKPVILDYRFQWNYQPTGHVIGHDGPFVPIAAENDRPDSAPALDGNLTIGAFNVLNYFDDLGRDEEDCDYFADRFGDPVAADFCEVRGAWSEAAFEDQEEKLVAAINKSGADILGLMEIQNSAGVSYLPGQPRDKALATLVSALNEDAGETRWAYAPSPVVTPTNEDIIRTAYIYDPSTVQLLGASDILLDDAFANARYPLAQKFKATRTGNPFVLIANHFKSKGSGANDGTGQGLANPSREEQARALTGWVEEMYADEAVFLVGDFNAYSKETPVQIIEGAGYANLAKEADPMSATYQFSGRLGSLDHMFANAKAQRLVTGAAVWDINGDESIAFQYSRRNYNVTDFHAPDEFASSDHDAVLVGLDTGPRGKAKARGRR
ncbi:MAG: ExeM/NucH family extracellular endonuclease [Dermatophilaceae bacterium]|nr:ExeM/NucH family extracellular endonuclease [Intrasporangiaceae bacterium]